jgi:ferredoxin
MKTVLYYYTGTGNSLWSARCLAQALSGAELVSLVQDPLARQAVKADAVGLVFPVHIWGVPQVMLDFISRLPSREGKYYFALAVNAGQVSATLRQLENVMAARGLRLSLGFSLKLPSNYTPWGGPGAPSSWEGRYREAREKISTRIAPAVTRRAAAPVEKGPLWQRILFTGIYRSSLPYIAKMDKDFWVDEACDGCALCAKLCPAGNIRLESGKPRWAHRCTQCLACLHWCPRASIQFGKKTRGVPRYHHPEITSADMRRGAPGK